MLGKLIKNELKASSKIVLLLNIFIATITIIGVLLFMFAFIDVTSTWSILLAVLYVILYILSISSVFIGLTIYIAVCFYKNIYSNEGYLMHTLPVSPRELLLSKFIVGGLYTFLTGLTFTISLCILCLSACFSAAETIQDLQLFYIETGIEMAYLAEQINFSFLEGIIFIIAFLFVSAFSTCSLSFVSISLGQLFTKQKVLGAVISYFGLSTFIQTISSFTFFPLNMSITLNMTSYNFTSLKWLMWAVILICMAYTIVSYFVTEHLMGKKLNLD